jgi:creatinine deaminase
MDPYVDAAHQQAVKSVEEGGFPVGAVLVKDGQVIGSGFNRYAQTGDPTTHAEIEAIRDAAARAGEGRSMDVLAGATCYTTMMPCEMCSGAIIRFDLAAVVVAEVSSYPPADTRRMLEERGIRVEIRDEDACKATVEAYYAEHPEARGADRPSDRRWSRPPG